MNKIIALFAIWLAGLTLVYAEEIIDAPGADDEQAVISSSKIYIRTLDAGQYEESWIQFAPDLQKTMPKIGYTTGLKLMRAGLGDIKTRKFVGVNFIKDLKGAPPGIYAALFLDSDFHRISGREKVILMKTQGKWMIAGYFFEKSVKFNQQSK
jgi:hypothetical protein